MGRVRQNYQTIKSLSNFGCGLLLVQVVVFLLLAIFLRLQAPQPHSPPSHDPLTALTSTMALTLLGFGLLWSSLQHYQLTPVTLVLLVVIITFELHALMYPFWLRLLTGFTNYPVSIQLNPELMIRAVRCGLSAVIGLGAAGGRLSPKEVLKLLPLFVFGYTLNQTVGEKKIQAFDAGGTMYIHTYGATFALVVSFISAKKIPPRSIPSESYQSLGVSLLGTLLAWACWPAFNYALFSQTPLQRTLVTTNTFLSLAGSTVTTIGISALYKEGLSVLAITRGTIAGGVAIGVCSIMIYVPGIALAVGVIAGAASFFSLRHLQGRFELAWGLLDTCGVFSLSLVPSIIGSVASCVILSAYHYQGIDARIAGLTNPSGALANHQYTLTHRAGLQIGLLSLSMGAALLSGGLSGFLMVLGYSEDPQDFYSDDWLIDIELPSGLQEQRTMYNLEGGTRVDIPSSSARFQTKDIEQVSNRPRPKKILKTRYQT